MCNNIDELGGQYANWNKTEKDKYYVLSLICEIFTKKKKKTEYKKTDTNSDTEN